jgi:hypothetical protein
VKVAIFTDTFLPQINGVTNTLNKLIEYYEANNIEYSHLIMIQRKTKVTIYKGFLV